MPERGVWRRWTISGKVNVKLEFVEGMDDVAGKDKRRRVHVQSATEVAMSDGTEAKPEPADPYAVVYWNNQELLRTDIAYSTRDPVWDESALIWVPADGGSLRIELFDWDQAENSLPGVARNDDFVGEANITIGVSESSLGGVHSVPTESAFPLGAHVVREAHETRMFADAAEAAGTKAKEKTDEQLAAISKCLETIRWFAVNCSNSAARLHVAKYVRRKELKKGSTLFKEGASANSMYVVFSGTLEVRQNGKCVARLGSGATVGERALMGDMDELMENEEDLYGSESEKEDDLDGSVRYSTAVASTDVVLGHLTAKKFYSVPDRRRAKGSAEHSGCAIAYKRLSLRAFALNGAKGFHLCILCCILLQAVALGFETRVEDHALHDAAEEVLLWKLLNTLMLLIFSAEVVLKIVALLNPWQDWVWFTDFWTIFDTVIVILCWIPTTPPSVLVFRVLRLFRVLKEFNSLPQLKMIVHGLMDAMTGLWFVMLLLIMMFYFYGVIGIQLFVSPIPASCDMLVALTKPLRPRRKTTMSTSGNCIPLS